ncbi:MAG: response regulator transcription factor [Candidatus Nanopelagicaceae bacterium]
MAKGQILVVDDEQAIRDLMSEVLAIAGFEVVIATDGLDGLNKIRKQKFDLIILDVNLPKLDGFAILEKVRASAPTQPIILISARTDKNDVTHGLRLGADDYVRKPFSVEELVLRVENRLKRHNKNEAGLFTCGPITLNDTEHLVTFNEKSVELSPTEYNLLLILIQNQNRVMSKEKLLDLVWGLDFETSTNVVDTYISYLRKKLHRTDFEGIKTIRGVGFKLEQA